MNDKFKIKFSKPNYGWLPVEINVGNINLKFEASDVPTDPLSLLVNALDSALCNSRAEVWWHLEPAGYYMTISNVGNEFEINMEYSDKSQKHNRVNIFKYVGNSKRTILPVWRALQEFYSHQYSEPSWLECETKLMDNLTFRIKTHTEYKNSYPT